MMHNLADELKTLFHSKCNLTLFYNEYRINYNIFTKVPGEFFLIFGILNDTKIILSW